MSSYASSNKKKNRDKKAHEKEKVGIPNIFNQIQNQNIKTEKHHTYDSEPESIHYGKKKTKKSKSRSEKKNGKSHHVSKFFDNEAEEGSGSEPEVIEGKSSKQNQQLRDQYYNENELKRKTKAFDHKLVDIETRAKKDERKRQKREERTQMVKQDYDQFMKGKFQPSVDVRKGFKYDADDDDEDDDDGSVDGYKSQDYYEDEDQIYSTKRAHLPSTSAAKLWQVKVKRGMEKIATMALMNKSVHFAQLGKPLEILSATCADNVENYIFVEAFRKNSVLEAVQGLNFVLNKVEMLSLDEMTKLYENLNSSGTQVIPDPGSWVRVKQTLYDKDIGVVEKIEKSGNRICVKIIPRIDPTSSSGRVFKRGFMSRAPQKAFQSGWQGAYKTKPPGFTKHFWSFKGQIFRKGFLYKTFSMKQLETGSEVKPTLEERAQFLEIFETNTQSNQSLNAQGQDSSDQDAEETRRFYKSEKGIALSVGDKIRVVNGELQGTLGVIESLECENLVFKPSNLAGFDEKLSLQKACVVKYFEVGDMIRIAQGKYSGETGIVTSVINETNMKTKKKENDVGFHPVIKLDKSQREMRINRNMLKMKTDHDQDFQQNEFMKAKSGRALNGEAESLYKVFQVGEMIKYNKGQNIGYIIQVQSDMVKIVNDQGCLSRIALTEIELKSTKQELKLSRANDCQGNGLQIGDVVKVSDQGSYNKLQRGIIKSIYKLGTYSYVFLWDRTQDYNQSHGIICEKSMSVQLLGTEFLANRQDGNGFQNRIQHDRQIGKKVVISRGPYKGQKGTIKSLNIKEIFVELITKRMDKPLRVDKLVYNSNTQQHEPGYIMADNDGDGYDPQEQQRQPSYGGGGGGASNYGGGGQTMAYDASKTPNAYKMGGADEGTGWGGATPAADGKVSCAGADWAADDEAGGGNAGFSKPAEANGGDTVAAGGWGQQEEEKESAAGEWDNDRGVKNEGVSGWG